MHNNQIKQLIRNTHSLIISNNSNINKVDQVQYKVRYLINNHKK
jgi:hypothetical protein